MSVDESALHTHTFWMFTDRFQPSRHPVHVSRFSVHAQKCVKNIICPNCPHSTDVVYREYMAWLEYSLKTHETLKQLLSLKTAPRRLQSFSSVGGKQAVLGMACWTLYLLSLDKHSHQHTHMLYLHKHWGRVPFPSHSVFFTRWGVGSYFRIALQV